MPQWLTLSSRTRSKFPNFTSLKPEHYFWGRCGCVACAYSTRMLANGFSWSADWPRKLCHHTIVTIWGTFVFVRIFSPREETSSKSLIQLKRYDEHCIFKCLRLGFSRASVGIYFGVKSWHSCLVTKVTFGVDFAEGYLISLRWRVCNL